MAIGPLIFLAVLALVHHPRMVSDITDSATLDRLQEHEKRLTSEMGRLQVELDQKNWDWDPRQSQEQWTTDDLTAEDGTWDGWHYVGLVILILFGCCRCTIEKEPNYDSSTDSSSTTTNEDYEDTDLEPEYYEPKQKLLDDFYDHHVEMETSETTSLCDFVETFVNDLLEESRNALPYQNTLPLLENCIGVGSAFEGWPTKKFSKTFCVLVPVLPPKGHSFHVETSDSEGAPSKHGHISVEMECMCKREKLLGDVVCFLHHPERKLSQEEQGKSLMHVLCTSSHLDGEKTIQWFQALLSKVWDTLGQKYNLSLTILHSNKTCQLKLEFPSRKIFIDILLGVQQGDSLVFLTTQDGKKDNLNGNVWHKSFAIQELLFFKWVSQRAPKDSCHLKCLQILIFFKESNTPEKKNPVLTNYHYKTCLMHLLLLWPLSYWEPEKIAQRLQDILLYMNAALEEKYLEHFLIGNIALPIQIPLPKSLRSAVPFNLFEHLAQDPNLHAKAINEFVDVVEQVRVLWLAPEE
ncbi:inositol 1,4,5-trisphosphate receptor-interacting protein-like 1 [Liasis olivaceus]